MSVLQLALENLGYLIGSNESKQPGGKTLPLTCLVMWVTFGPEAEEGDVFQLPHQMGWRLGSLGRI